MRSIFGRCIAIAMMAAIALAWQSPPAHAGPDEERDVERSILDIEGYISDIESSISDIEAAIEDIDAVIEDPIDKDVEAATTAETAARGARPEASTTDVKNASEGRLDAEEGSG